MGLGKRKRIYRTSQKEKEYIELVKDLNALTRSVVKYSLQATVVGSERCAGERLTGLYVKVCLKNLL